jgi:hypothetical protein
MKAAALRIRNIAQVMVISAVVALLTTGAMAQQKGATGIDPQCSQMRDKIACTCALQTGGRIDPNSQRYTYPASNINGYASCMVRNGRK